ncbi:OmpA family protein [candidate division KSB1 bacterium]
MMVEKSTKGAGLLVLLGIIIVVSYFFLKPILFERKQRATSDAVGSSTTIRIGGDNYIGYFFTNSQEMTKMAARKGLIIQFTDDGALYEERLDKFKNGEYDCIVLPVNSYLQHGEKVGYPGVIVAAISESRGADGMVVHDITLPDFNSLNDAGRSFVYIPDSPSSFLLDLLIHDFDLDKLKNSDAWRMTVGSPDEIYEAAKNGQGDIYVTWEPTLTKIAELDGMNYSFGSNDFRGYIIDVFVFDRDFIEKHRDEVVRFFQTYYQVMGLYANNIDNMYNEMKKSPDLKRLEDEELEKLLEKVEWYDLYENCSDMFGINIGAGGYADEAIINCIINCTYVMINAGIFSTDPLKGNPYEIVNSDILRELSKTTTSLDEPGTQAITFEPLTKEQWAKLHEVGKLKEQDITFSSSFPDILNVEGEETVDKIASLLTTNYPSYRVIVRGHTPTGGDESLNEKLSLERAQNVMARLTGVYLIDPNRIRAEGVGGSEPPEPKYGETPRQRMYRSSRVEFILIKENPF